MHPVVKPYYKFWDFSTYFKYNEIIKILLQETVVKLAGGHRNLGNGSKCKKH